MQLTIVKISRKPKETKYGLKTSVGLLTKEYQDKWLNGWGDNNNARWQPNQVVEATVEQNGEYLNFKTVPASVSPNMVNSAISAHITPNLSLKTPNLGYVAPKEVNWDAINFGKCKFGFLIEAYKLGKDPDVAEADAEDWAGRAMRKLGKVEMKDFGQGESLSEIPF